MDAASDRHDEQHTRIVPQLSVRRGRAAIERAIAAGATAIHPVNDAHGWRLGRIEDPFGHHWEIGKPLVLWPPDSLPRER